jgi:hypothetical protein
VDFIIVASDGLWNVISNKVILFISLFTYLIYGSLFLYLFFMLDILYNVFLSLSSHFDCANKSLKIDTRAGI